MIPHFCLRIYLISRFIGVLMTLRQYFDVFSRWEDEKAPCFGAFDSWLLGALMKPFHFLGLYNFKSPVYIIS